MSSLRTHELHPGVVHAPLVLLPTAALVDLAALRARDGGMARVGRGLWIAASAGGVVSAVTGFAASQEVKAEDAHSKRMMWLHGVGNAAVLGAMLVLTGLRMRRPPHLAHALTGLAVTAASLYTADLGGGMVYDHGVGVANMPHDAPQGLGNSPKALSGRGIATLLRDTFRGVAWLARETAAAAK